MRRSGLSIQCPACNSREVRAARPHGLRERLLSLFGFQAARCSDCAEQFLARPFRLTHVTWAKCPRCYRMDLSTWDPRFYRATAWMRVRLWLGAHRWRCAACRCNFISFRPRKEKYVRAEPASAPPSPLDSPIPGP